MKDKRAWLMGEAKIERALISMAIPAIIGMLINAIYNFVDKVFVGKLGTEQFSAATVVFPLFMMIGAVGLTFGIGAATYISRLLGEGDKKQATKTVSTALFSSAVAGLIYIIVGVIYIEPIVRLFGATDTMLEYAIEYGRILTLGSIFTMVNMTMNNMLRAEGSAKMAMISMSIGAILNIILDPIFIFVFDMGIAGAAIATVLAQMVSTGLLLGYYLTGKSVLKLRIKYISITGKIYGQIMKIGVPTFIRQILASLGMAVINNMAKPYGNSAIAAMGIVLTVIMMSYYILFGFNQGFQPIAGYNFGAKKYDRLNKAIKVSVSWTTIYSTIITIIFMVFAKPIIMLFSDDTSVINTAIKALRAYAIFLPFMGALITFTGLFQALGHAIESAILSLARQGFFLIPAILILPRFFELDGVIFAQPVADGLTVFVTAILSIGLMKELIKKEKAQEEIAN